jgi:hypothetical protein
MSGVLPVMFIELQTYQSSPCGQTLGDFWIAAEPLARGVARDVLQKLGRAQDAWLLDAMLAESAFRVAKMSHRLLTLEVESEAALAAYIKKIVRSAAYTAADDPIAGPSRRNAKRWVEPGQAMNARSWPRNGSSRTMIGNVIPESGGRRTSFSFTDHSGGPDRAAPSWMLADDRDHDWQRLVTFVATAARFMASGNEIIAVEQVLAGQSDAATAAKIGIAKATWQDRKRAALTGLAPRITAAASWEMDELGEKLIGDLWIQAANHAAMAVLIREASSEAA